MDSETKNRLRESLSDTVTEFFRDYGVECATASEPPPSIHAPEMGSMVGFRGEQMRGGLALVAPVDLVAATLPVKIDSTRFERQLRDWSGEMANQLVGRLKNKLSTQQLDFEVGMPSSFKAATIRFSLAEQPVDGEGASCACFIAKTGARIYLDCSYLEIVPRADLAEAESPLGEGEVLLF